MGAIDCMPPMIRGLDILEEESLQYAVNFVEFRKTGRIRSGIVPIVGIMAPPDCNYSCVYCIYGNSPSKSSEGLTNEEIERLLNEAAILGAKTIEIAGSGEPTIWKGLPHLVDEAAKKNLRVVVFTNGAVIANNDGLMRMLFESGASVIIKFNSFKDDVQNFLCGHNRAHEWRDKSLQKALEIGFNREMPTRLGIESVITTMNINEISQLWHFARERNIFPFFESLHLGGPLFKTIARLNPSYEELKELFATVAMEDKVRWGYKWEPELPYIGFPCTVYDHVLVNYDGKVSPCFEFGSRLGNVREKSLVEILRGSEMLGRIRELRLAKRGTMMCRDAEGGNQQVISAREITDMKPRQKTR